MRALPPFGGTAVAESPDSARGGLRFSFLQSQGMPCTHVSSFGCCHKRLRFLTRLASHLRPGSVTFLLDDWPLFAASPRRHLCVSRSAGISAAILAFEPGSPVHPRGRASGCPTPAAASRPAWPAQQGPGHHGAQPRRGQPCRGRPALARPGSSFGPDQAARGHASPGHAARYPSEHGESSQRRPSFLPLPCSVSPLPPHAPLSTPHPPTTGTHTNTQWPPPLCMIYSLRETKTSDIIDT